MSLNISSEVSLKFSGKDAFSFVDSLISNSISESETKFSYLLGPDGKVISGAYIETTGRAHVDRQR